jgi:hypothetical protein
MLLTLLSYAIAIGLAVFLYGAARRFVRDRLRYVDAVQKGIAPWLAGGAAFLVGALVAPILPLVSLGTAITAGIAVGSGVAAGVRDIRRGLVPAVWQG